MTKKSFVSTLCVVPLLIVLCFLLASCGCKHEWQAADCETPKTCSLCEETEGEALGHTWQDATCETPKTCSVCQKTEGDALGHTWTEATCQVLKTCSVCQKTEGELADHKWEDATTEAPKTCTVCQKTEGERIITDSRFQTAANKELFGTWQGTLKIPCEDIVGEGFAYKVELNYAITFNNDGSYEETSSMIDSDSFITKVENFYIDTLYQEFVDIGYSKTQADEAMQAEYGMDVETYSKYTANAINWESLFAFEIKGVYYISNGKLYSGSSWNSTLESDSYTISGHTLTIESLAEEFPELALTRTQVDL